MLVRWKRTLIQGSFGWEMDTGTMSMRAFNEEGDGGWSPMQPENVMFFYNRQGKGNMSVYSDEFWEWLGQEL